MTKTIKEKENRASALVLMAKTYSRCGIFSLAAKNYHEAADIYTELGQKERSLNCRYSWFLSEIGVAC